MEIKSDASKAQVHATGLQTGGSSLSGVSQAQEDGSTTVAGNTNAHEVMQAAQTNRESIGGAMTQMVTNIHSVASEFEAVDEEAAGNIGG